MGWPRRRALAGRLRERFGLAPDQRVGELSKGKKAMAGLLLALAFRPSLLLLDEPTSGLDVAARRVFYETVLAEYQAEGGTLLIASHQVHEIAGLVDHLGVLRDGGLYISQHKQPTSLQISHRDAFHRYTLGVSYYHQGPLPDLADIAYRESGTREYLHRWQDLIGGLCRVGFVIEDLVEPRRGDPQAAPGHYGHRGMIVPPYVRIKARRVSQSQTYCDRSPIWSPG